MNNLTQSQTVVFVCWMMMVLSACRDALPTAPSELDTGIVVYEHANFNGASAHITRDVEDLSEFKGPCQEVESGVIGPFPGTGTVKDVWNDCISSVRIAPGWTATLYRGKGYDDDSIVLIADEANLQLVMHDCPARGLNDCVSSVRVKRN